MELIIIAIVVWFSIYLGYRMGGGQAINLIPQKFKGIFRTEEQELALEEQLKRRK